jgi:V8-like Glu-specific endopeptidase
MAENMSPADQLSFSTVRIACKTQSGGDSTGTGFFFIFPLNDNTNIPVIITNRHVIKNATEGTFQLTEANNNDTPNIGTFTTVQLDKFEGRWISHPNQDVDLCAMPIAPLLHEAENKGKTFFYRALSKDIIGTSEIMAELSALEEIVMIGYPVGIWDSSNNMPIFRKGIAATPPDIDYEGRKEFMIDIACFPGSSGSPVLLYNVGGYTTKTGNVMLGSTRIKLLGVLYAGPQYTVEGNIQVLPVPTKTIPISVSKIPTNLGLVIKAERLLEFEDIFLKMNQEGKSS